MKGYFGGFSTGKSLRNTGLRDSWMEGAATGFVLAKIQACLLLDSENVFSKATCFVLIKNNNRTVVLWFRVAFSLSIVGSNADIFLYLIFSL